MDKKDKQTAAYQHALDKLYFSEGAKEQMIKNLLENNHKNTVISVKRRKVSRLAVAGIAAALLLSMGAGAAVVYHQLASESFLRVFGGAHTEVIDHIGRPVGASCTDNGITITADAIIGDKYHYAVTYSIEKTDGTSFDTSYTVGENCLPYGFDEDLSSVGMLGGAHGSSWFYDADPSDNAIQYISMLETDQNIVGRTFKADFHDLSYFDEEGHIHTLVEGNWKLKFALNFEDTSINLPAGQTFQLSDMTAEINAITLSPVAIRVDYTVNNEVKWDPNAQSGRMSDHDSMQSDRYLGNLKISLRMKDGTEKDFSNAGGSIKPENGKSICQKGEMFHTILPLEEVESVTVGNIIIPVSLQS